MGGEERREGRGGEDSGEEGTGREGRGRGNTEGNMPITLGG